jgi:biotin carboxyl carrier protein
MAGFTTGTTVPAKNTLPTQFTTTHNTDGLPGYGAFDWFRPAGTIVGSPFSGVVTRGKHGRGGTTGTIFGYSFNLKSDTGQELFLTHFSDIFVRPGQHVKYGQPLGRVSAWSGGQTHIHIGVKGAKDVGGHVNLGRPVGLDPATRVPPTDTPGGVGIIVGGAKGAAGAVGDVVGGITDVVTAPADAIRWIGDNWDRVLEVVGGFVITIAGLYLLARQLGAPKVSLPGGMDEGLERQANIEQRTYEATVARGAGRARAARTLGEAPQPSKPRPRAGPKEYGEVPF